MGREEGVKNQRRANIDCGPGGGKGKVARVRKSLTKKGSV